MESLVGALFMLVLALGLVALGIGLAFLILDLLNGLAQALKGFTRK